MPSPALAPQETPVSSSRDRAWRADLEGLRVVAILLVATYHVWADRVSGGVDVFLMLSGFFVGGGIWRRLSTEGHLRLRPYLLRHARRLLPASVTVLLATGVAVVLLLPVTRWGTGSEQTLASLAYAENWWLMTAGQSYGAADTDQSPWQHYWSLSVQGQLFVGVPLLLLGVWWLGRRLDHDRRVRLLAATVVSTTAASFAVALVLTRIDQPTAYFHTGARAWEFLTGMLLAMVLGAWQPRGRWWALLGWAGIALLVTTGFLVDGGTSFPGVATLLPIGAASAVVLAGAAAPGSLLARGLGWGPLARAGRYAYGFYLWHWPILVLAIAVRGRGVGWLAGAAVLVLAAVLAVATYHLIEAPLREGRSVRESLPSSLARGRPGPAGATARVEGARPARPRRTVLVASALALVVAAPAGWLGHVDAQRREASQLLGSSDLGAYPGALSFSEPEAYGDVQELEPIPELLLLDDDKTVAVTDGCFVESGSDALVECEYGDPDGSVVVAVVGGSHSEQWFGALDAVGRGNGMRVVPMLKAGCPLSLPETADHPECGRWLERVIDRLETDPPDFVVTTSTRPTGEGNDFVPAGYQGVFEQLSRSVPVIAIRDNPWLPVSMAECVALSSGWADCDIPLYDHISRDDPTDEIGLDDVAFIDMNDMICPGETCSAVQGNRYVYRDDNHLAATYLETVAPSLESRLLETMESLDGSTT